MCKTETQGEEYELEVVEIWKATHGFIPKRKGKVMYTMAISLKVQDMHQPCNQKQLLCPGSK